MILPPKISAGSLAQKTFGDRMIRIAADPHDAIVLDRCHDSASVWTVAIAGRLALDGRRARFWFCAWRLIHPFIMGFSRFYCERDTLGHSHLIAKRNRFFTFSKRNF